MGIDHIHKYLTGEQPFDFHGSNRHSSLIAGLRDCRNSTKRDLKTGKLDLQISHGDIGNWLGSIGYFILLDQIGSCFKKSGSLQRQPTYNTIKLAIEDFGFDLIDNSNDQLEALVALRNAFTHDYNLLDIPKNSKNNGKTNRKFTVTVDFQKWVVKLPKIEWDGKIESKDFSKTDDVTKVNLFGLGEMVEAIYSRLCDYYLNNQIELRMSKRELINKYTFVIFES
jgi:hypothetical protein